MSRKAIRIIAFAVLGFSLACLAILGLSLLSPEKQAFFAIAQNMTWLEEVALLGAIAGASLGVILNDHPRPPSRHP